MSSKLKLGFSFEDILILSAVFATNFVAKNPIFWTET